MWEVRTSWSHSFPINKSAAHQDLPGFASQQPGTHVGWLCELCSPPLCDPDASCSQGVLSGPWPGSPGIFQRAAEDPGLVCALQANHSRSSLLQMSRRTFPSALLSFLGQHWLSSGVGQSRGVQSRMGAQVLCTAGRHLGQPPLQPLRLLRLSNLPRQPQLWEHAGTCCFGHPCAVLFP